VDSATEIEAKLRVRAGSADAVFASVAAMRELAGCRLEAAGSREQRDVYWDTPRAELRARRAALRTRWIGADPVPSVALKRDEASAGGAGEISRRREWERPWSERAASELAHELAALGIAQARPRGAASLREPEAALRALGLLPLQVRATRRARLLASSAAGRVAEIALDRVAFALAGREIRHCEIEIEALGAGARAEVVAELSDALQRACGAALVPWRCNKLVLGLALAELAARPGALALGADGVPDEASYARIEALAAERWPN
jgi:inorganic triphosphatase YgiF